jgi:hypothetical protein
MIHDLGVFESAELGVVLHELEEGSEFGVFGALLNRLNCLAFFKRDHLVAGKMNCQAVNSRVHTMHIHFEDSVNCLGSGDVAPLKVCLDLIIDLPVATGPNETAFRTVVALVHVLVHVLDGADAAADFDVDVAVVLEEQGGIVGHHPLVGEQDGVTTCAVGMRPGGSATVVGAGVDGVGVVAGLRLCLERFGKAFGAGSVAHARRVGVVASATGPVEHVLGDGRVKTWLGLAIGELGGDDGVYVGRRAGFVLRSEVDEYVRVWEAPFLKLDNKEIGHDLAQNLSLLQVVHESFPLHVEHARAKVRPVGGLLMGKQVAPDFRPVRVAGHGDKAVRLPVFGAHGNGVGTGLLHVARAAREG